MKKSITKVIAVCLCAALTVSGIAYTSYAMNSDTDQTEKAQKTSVTDKDDNNTSSKDEMVYVFSQADGSVQKIIVSDWIKNVLNSRKLNDSTELSDIENVNGDESYAQKSDGSIVWDAQGNDIYYQGNIKKDLPVNMSVTYKLDGKTVSPSELLGKSGKVTIRYDYTNQQYEYKEINGNKEKIYVPFAVVTGVVLDNDVFTNVKVSGGKLVNDGSRTAVIGIALPGLQENLAVADDKFDIPDHVEITADAKKFELGMTITLATNQLFNELDAESFKSIDGLTGSMGELSGSMDKLLSGSSGLYDGLSDLLKSFGELSGGIDKLASGTGELKSGAGDLNTGASKLQAGASQLKDGLDTLVSNNDSLNGGAKQVFDTLLSSAGEQLTASGLKVPALTIDNYSETLNGVIASLDKSAVYEKALATVKAAVEEKRPFIEEQVSAVIKEQVTEKVTAAVREQVIEKVTQAVRDTVEEQVIKSAVNMDKDSYDKAIADGLIDKTTQAAIKTAIEQQMESEQISQTIQAQTDEQMSSQPVLDTIAAKTNEQMNSDSIKKTAEQNVEEQVQKAISENMSSDEVQSQLTAASEGAKSVISLKASLDSYNAFYLGLKSYTDGVSQVAAGAKELKAGTDELKAGTDKLCAGANELNTGILTLKQNIPAFANGITQLCDGAKQLSEGLSQFNKQGIQKLIDAVDGDINGLVTRLRATKEVSQSYKTFSCENKDISGQVKFIYRTEPIE